MDPKKITEKIWTKIQKYRHQNEGEAPFCILLDPHTIFLLEKHFYDNMGGNSLAAEWMQYRGGQLWGIRVFIPKQWDKGQGQILEVR